MLQQQLANACLAARTFHPTPSHVSISESHELHCAYACHNPFTAHAGHCHIAHTHKPNTKPIPGGVYCCPLSAHQCLMLDCVMQPSEKTHS
jgi:hypothetical protein